MLGAGWSRRSIWSVVLVGAAVGGAGLLGMFFDNHSALTAELNTSYPGARRSTGLPLSPSALLGAPGLLELEEEPVPKLLNQSELSSAFLICAVLAALLWPRLRRDPDSRAQSSAATTLACAIGVWSLWITLPWGTFGESVPVLNLVPPLRVAQTLGVPAALLLCVVLGRVTAARSSSQILLPAVLCALLTGYAVGDLRNALSTLGSGKVWLIAIGTGLAAAALIRFPRSRLVTVAITVLLAIPAVTVNPIIFGLGDLRASDSARAARALRDEAGPGYVASDSWLADGLLVANGVPLVTGYQVTGPVRSAWAKVDPEGQYEPVWNRGASYLKMEFAGAPGSAPVVSNPAPDVIMITVDPCWLRRSGLRVRYLVTERTLTGCVRRTGGFTWSGRALNVYTWA